MRKVPPSYKSIGTSATEVYKVTSGRKAKIKKLWLHNTDTANDRLVAFCDSDGNRISPQIKVPAGQTLFISEDELPEMEFSGSIYMIADGAGVDVLPEVDEQ